MIEVKGLKKHFGDVVAVDGIDFQVPDGAVTGLLGPNGAGKTTTLRMLYGLMVPDAGHLTVDGINVSEEPQSAQARMGVLPDQQGLYPRLTAREHLRYFGQLHGMGPELGPEPPRTPRVPRAPRTRANNNWRQPSPARASVRRHASARAGARRRAPDKPPKKRTVVFSFFLIGGSRLAGTFL